MVFVVLVVEAVVTIETGVVAIIAAEIVVTIVLAEAVVEWNVVSEWMVDVVGEVEVGAVRST